MVNSGAREPFAFLVRHQAGPELEPIVGPQVERVQPVQVTPRARVPLLRLGDPRREERCKLEEASHWQPGTKVQPTKL